MRSATRLKSAVFQLTPTRTRCDLVIVSNGKTKKIVSGLVNPFLSHLKTAQDQISKGGYSIKLEPDPSAEAAWFTKETVERFVRFVSTPEVLERVNTIEYEILQIEQAISYQRDDNLGLSIVEDHHHRRAIGSTIGCAASSFNGFCDQVCCKPGSHPNPPESSGSKVENSIVQLLRVLESRKKVLQKEQAMAFARAAAAGFDSDNIADLISFSKSFGAMRLMDACMRYMQLWKDKHETGQWIEVEAAEALSYKSEFSLLNTPGINLSRDDTEPKEALKPSSISDGDISMVTKSNLGNLDNGKDKASFSEALVPNGQSEYHQGQFPHSILPQWPMHARPGLHVFQPFPSEVMPYYQNCPLNGQFFHPLPPQMQDPSFTHQRKGNKKHSRNSKDGASTPEVYRITSEFEKEPSRHCNSLQKAGRYGKEKGAVVIQNLNYITGRGHETFGNGFESSPDSEFGEGKDSLSDKRERNHNPLGSSKRRGIYVKPFKNSSVDGKDEQPHLQEADAGNWQAFQKCLLRVEEKMTTTTLDGERLTGEKEDSMVKKRQNKGEHDSKLLPKSVNGNCQEVIMGYDAISCKGNRSKQLASADELLVSKEDSGNQGSHTDAHFTEVKGLRSGYKKSWDNGFLIHRREKQMDSKMPSDPPIDYERDINSEKSALHCVTDESFLVPFRSGSHDELGRDIVVTTDVDREFPSAPKRNKDSFNGAKTRVGYEPHDLNLVPERTKDKEPIGYDPAKDYGILALVIKKQTREEYCASSTANEDLMKDDKEKKRKSANSELEKKRKDPTVRKMTSSRSMTLNEAQKKAQKQQDYKANVQKLKKEQEEEEIRRLETLKRERQKRIATRSNACSTRSSANLQQKKSRLPIKGSLTACKSSKFMDFKQGSTLHQPKLPGHTGLNGFVESNKKNKTSRLDSKSTDSELGSNLPLPNMPRRAGSIGFVDFDKANKTSRSNKLSRSASLPEPKKENVKQERSSHPARIRRLSEPNGNNFHSIPGNSAISYLSLKKTVALEPQSKKMSALVQLDRASRIPA